MYVAVFRIFSVLLAVMAISSGAESRAIVIPSLPRDFSNVDIYLGTRDIGHEVYSKYGHTIVRIVNHENRSDIGYNWGTFDFYEPGYILKFIKGILIYRMSYGPWNDEIEVSQFENQTTWMERVNLTTKQKEILVKRINWQAQPENAKYPYRFFYDNCSTRVRDFFDEALGGRIKARTSKRMSGKTYRDRVLEHNASEPMLAMGQDVILNSEPDQEMSQWDDMFIPIRLRDYLMEMQAIDDNNQEIPGLKLLSDTEVITNFPRPETPIFNGFFLVCFIAGVPALLGVIFVTLENLKKLGIRFIGLANIALGVLWSFFGLFMILQWAFGGHSVAVHNANLWLMWPLDFLYVVAGFKLLRGRFLDPASKFYQLMFRVTSSHLIGIGILMVGQWTHLISQDTSRVVVYFVPLTALVFCIALMPLRLLKN